MHSARKSSAPEQASSTSPVDPADMADEAWSVLSESLVIREQMIHACAEVKVAIDGIRARLDRLGVKLIEASDDESQPTDELLRRRA